MVNGGITLSGGNTEFGNNIEQSFLDDFQILKSELCS